MPTPRRSFRERLRESWWVYARWLIVAVPILGLGFGFGMALFVFTHAGTYTGSEEVTRPAPQITSFTWPLRLGTRVNVLIIGVDVTINERRQIVPISRSDTLMLASFDPGRNRISALSIPRDTRVMIPGVGESKVNAAYAFGGPGLTVRTVASFLRVPVHYYVKLGPQSFARIIDAIGGVEIDVEKDMKYTDRWAGLYINLKKGRQLLNGEQAMHYARFRHDPAGDIGRVERQQKVLLALFHKLKSPSTVLSAPQLLRAFAENTQTNLTFTELITLGVFTSRLDGSDVTFATLPGTNSIAFWEPDAAKMRQVVAEMFYGVDASIVASTEIEVLNGSGVPGLARQAADRLQAMGFRIVRVDNAPSVVETTTIIDRSGRPGVARLVADVLGRSRIKRQTGVGPDLTVIVARDLTRGRAPALAARLRR
ncbi:MAG: LCP family protein [Armatimonadetes bacterium]|nr:LCP family protein [Armatimonadota bacterium]